MMIVKKTYFIHVYDWWYYSSSSGTVGVDFLVSPENGIKGFTLSFGLKADIPEVHIGGGN